MVLNYIINLVLIISVLIGVIGFVGEKDRQMRQQLGIGFIISAVLLVWFNVG